MSEVSNSDLLNVLLDIKQDLGSIKATAVATTDRLTDHIQKTAATEGRVFSLEMSRARQKGVLATLSAAGAALGGAIGYAAEFFHRG